MVSGQVASLDKQSNEEPVEKETSKKKDKKVEHAPPRHLDNPFPITLDTQPALAKAIEYRAELPYPQRLQRSLNTLPGDIKINPRKECKALTLTKEVGIKEMYVAEELEEEKAQGEIGRTLLHIPLVAQEPKVPHPQKL
ncbi:hypothetical protein AHAS_Ahas04G0101800 [Arachis hypogaea]